MISFDEHRGDAARRVVLTGGPGAGKTAVLEVVKRRFGDRVAVLPEAATIVFGGGFPRYASVAGRRASQLAIFHVQDQLERAELACSDAKLLLCDRGVVDGAAYWPGPPDEYWAAVGESPERALARYDAVVHLRTPRAEHGYGHSNPLRVETAEEAARIDARLAEVWAAHPRCVVIPSAEDFVDKVRAAIDVIARFVPLSSPSSAAHAQ